MPKRLAQTEPTVKMELRLPASSLEMAKRLAGLEHEGNVSLWVRSLIRRESARLSTDTRGIGIGIRKFSVRDAADRLKARGYCDGPAIFVPVPGDVDASKRARCWRCNKLVAVTTRGLYAHHKPREVPADGHP